MPVHKFRVRTRLLLLPVTVAGLAATLIACGSTTDGHPQAGPTTASETSAAETTSPDQTSSALPTAPVTTSVAIAPYAGDAATVTCSQYKGFDDDTMASVLNSLATTYGPGWKINPGNTRIVASLCNIWPDKLVKALMYGD